jgi:two-component system LytT family response regulator
MKYSCLVADDNVIERDAVSMFLQKIPNIEIIAECESGTEAAAILADQHIDIVFSDIDMPNLDGIGLLKSLRNPPVFIFITSFEDFAVESWNLDVIDFILKPVKFDRLLKAVNKAIEYLQFKAIINTQKLNTITAEHSDNQIFADDHFFIKETKGITKLKYAEVLFIESMGDFSKIITVQGQSHIILSGLKSLLEQLPLNIFKRVHKQYIVNLNHIHTVAISDIHFYNNQIIPISSLYRQELLEAFVNKDIIKRKSD